MSLKAILENRLLQMKGPLPATTLFLKSAKVVEGLSKVTEITVEFLSPDRALDLTKLVGKPISVNLKAENDAVREFAGTCVEAQYLGLYQGYGLYTAELRPWLWFMTRARNNRIFQDLKVIDIIKKVFGDHGFSDFDDKTSRSFEPRVYTVQYRETDFDFLARLMQEEGVYYYVTAKDGKDQLVIGDGTGAHPAIEGRSELDFHYREPKYRRRKDHVYEWQGSEGVTTGKVTLSDYNFEKPKADLKTVNTIVKGQHSHKSYENYTYPGRYRETALGDIYARIKMEQVACEQKTRKAVGNVRTLAAGATFKLQGHPRNAENGDYMITQATHWLQIETDYEDDETTANLLPGRLVFAPENKDTYRCHFEVIPKDVPYRAPFETPWPEIAGILIARVTGPAGDEIFTDKYGRIKVQFPWDRDGKNDDKTTCFVRAVTPWAGKNWGFIAIPRIGQEVTIQFEDGNPDRPICTGMLQNADNMPPYELPGKMTQSGIKTRSTKGGGETNYNELVFEDKKGEEYIRFHAEKNYYQTVENDAIIRIGLDKKDKGDLTQTIHRHKTETLKTGDHTFTVEDGNEIRKIKKDKTETIEGLSTLTVTKDVSRTFKANETNEVTGDVSHTIKKTQTTKVTKDITITSDTGSITIEAMTEIKLVVGKNSITIDQMGVTIDAVMVKVAAKTTAEVQAMAMLTLKGLMTMIN